MGRRSGCRRFFRERPGGDRGRHGRPLGAPDALAQRVTHRMHGHGLADTLENQIRQRYHDARGPLTPSTVEGVRALAGDCVDARLEVPGALALAEELYQRVDEAYPEDPRGACPCSHAPCRSETRASSRKRSSARASRKCRRRPIWDLVPTGPEPCRPSSAQSGVHGAGVAPRSARQPGSTTRGLLARGRSTH